MNKMIDFMQTKQDELGKKRLNMSNVKLPQHLEFSTKKLKQAVGFTILPQKVKEEDPFE